LVGLVCFGLLGRRVCLRAGFGGEDGGIYASIGLHHGF